MLIQQPSFGPYFWTTTLGVLVDNLFKNLVVLLLVFRAAEYGVSGGDAVLANLVAGLFIVPFVLFSGLGGELASRLEPSRLFVILKWVESAIIFMACLGLVMHWGYLLLVCVFLIGAQAAFFGPIKYAYIPRVVSAEELMAANAYVETSTFLAILLGTLLAGALLSVTDQPHWQLLALASCSAVGVWQAHRIPRLPMCAVVATLPALVWQDIYRSVRTCMQATHEQLSVRRSVLAISAFWFTGALVLANLPGLAKNYLDLGELGFSALLAVFSVGVGLGSWFAERLSGKQVEIGLVPLGALGMVLALLGLWQQVNDVWAFGGFLAGLGVAGGLFVVPLYALIQLRAAPGKTASVIAFLNIQNSVFMILAALLAMTLLMAGLELHNMLLVGALFNIFVCAVVFKTVPEFMARFVVFLLVHTVYRFRVQGYANFPKEGAAYIAPNHISWIDAFMLSAACRRPFAFVMYYKIFNIPVINWFFKAMKAIPIAGKNEDERVYLQAMTEIKRRIESGHLVCIFPEGAISRDGEVAPFKPGLLKMLELAPAPVIPVAIGRMWGSAFSRKHRRWIMRLPIWDIGRPVSVNVGRSIAPECVNMEALRNEVISLGLQKQ
ncbi:MAG TPA: MFS transporter [Limnobacter sp.]|nr:MFS transporter [Limnobacter sp.]